MRIGFLYNHDATHQIPHTIMIAAALAARGADVEILTSTSDQHATARDLLPKDEAIRFTGLSVGHGARLADLALRHVAPYRRIAILRHNLDRLAAFDALVVPETTTTLLRSRYGLASPRLIYVPHGAGDGAAGFQAATRRFDLVLLSGAKVRDRMLAAGLVSEAGSAIVGYPKFDLGAAAAPVRPFNNDRPTVLYNPHFNPKLSSWFGFGPAILRWFASQERFNLIFAPHVMLFRRKVHTSLIHRRVAVRPALPKLGAHAHMLLDTGSRRSIDMSYLRAADIYLGDVSSQIYEWIRKPRPAVLFDTHAPDWRDAPDYGQWRLGEVIDRLDALGPALDRALSQPNRFAAAQAEAASRTFSIEDRPAAERAADAIIDFLGDHSAQARPSTSRMS